jgi:MFS family permease
MGGYLAKSANMMRLAANKPVSPALGIFSPLRYAVFRRIWIASLLSNLGLLVLGVGAAWAMTKISSSTSMVALVQTSLMLPVALVSTPAGAIADMFDRRIVGLVALSIAFSGSISLSALAWLGVMPPTLLLASCFIIGSGMALFGPPGRRLSANKCQQRRCPRQSRSTASVTTLPAALGPQLVAS